MTGYDRNVYTLIEERKLPDIDAEGIYLRHIKSGARVLLLPCEDENKVFNIVFRTPPADSTGVAHILEHCVLCGSEKYPVKDPFVELEKGSLKTFLNAMTFSDKTMYPVASTNEQELFNLADVYLDSVFHPNIYKEENIFRQEGWGYRMEDADSPLTLSGVVYSEMKGVFSSADDVLEHRIMESLFPDTQYSVESGGDPEHIPDLTYGDFLDFHAKYYHPSNSYIFVYGDLDMERMLEFLDKEYLNAYTCEPVCSKIAYQEPFGKMAELTGYYPLEAGEDDAGRTYLTYNAVTGGCFDQKELLAMELIDYAVFSAPGAPLRDRLLKEGVGNDVYGIFSDGIMQPYYSVVAKNAERGMKERFLSVIKEVLEKLAGDGIDRDSLLARLNYLEFQFREGDFGVYPKGLMYSIFMMETWLYDEDRPFDAVDRCAVFDELRKEITGDAGYFEGLLRKNLLDNAHCSFVELVPVKGLDAENEKKLAEKLDGIKKSLSDADIADIVRKTEALREYQTREDDPAALASLPFLSPDDVERKARKYSNIVRKETYGSREAEIVWHDIKSRGIGYTGILFPADHITEDELFYLGLIPAVFQRMNTDKHTYLELSNTVNLNTGGISYGISVFEEPGRRECYRPYFGIKFKSFTEKTGDAFDIISEIICGTKTDDKERLFEVIAEKWSAMRMQLEAAGHVTAVNRANSYIRASAAFSEEIQGVSFFKKLDEIYRDYDNKAAEVMKGLDDIRRKLFVGRRMIINQTGDRETLDETVKQLAGFLEKTDKVYPASDTEKAPLIKCRGKLNEGLTTAGQVQYVALCGDFRELGYEFSGKMQVLRHILNFGYIWDRVRVDGNAYGCGCAFDRNGRISFMSYRDPHIMRTIDTYRALPGYLEGFEASEEFIKKNIIGTLSETDIPLTPSLYGTVAFQNYMLGIGDDVLQKERDEIFDTDAGDIRNMAGMIRDSLRESGFCVVGGGSKIAEHSEIFGSTGPLY